MDNPKWRWRLLGTTTNPSGVTHFTLSRFEVPADNGDSAELLQVLKREFAAVENGEMVGPDSVHQYLAVGSLRFGVILNWPDWLNLYARDQGDTPALAALITRLVEALERVKESNSLKALMGSEASPTPQVSNQDTPSVNLSIRDGGDAGCCT